MLTDKADYAAASALHLSTMLPRDTAMHLPRSTEAVLREVISGRATSGITAATTEDGVDMMHSVRDTINEKTLKDLDMLQMI